MPEGVPHKGYTPQFKKHVVETMLNEGLRRKETERRFELPHMRAAAWERICLEEGPGGMRSNEGDAARQEVVQELKQRHNLKPLLSIAQIPRAAFYNNRRIKAKLKGLPPALHRQQALSAAYSILLSNPLGTSICRALS